MTPAARRLGDSAGTADGPATTTVRVVVPAPLRQHARIDGEIVVDVAVDAQGEITQRTLLDAVEAKHPVLRGTMRDQDTKLRRAYVRFFACGRDLSMDSPDTPVPAAVSEGAEPFLVVGALAGG